MKTIYFITVLFLLGFMGYNLTEDVITVPNKDTIQTNIIPLDSILILNDTTGVYKKDTFLIKDYSLVQPTDSI